MFSSRVSYFWDAAKYTYINTNEYSEITCYTSWYSSKDITNKIISIQVPKLDKDYPPKETGVNGYQCSNVGNEAIFSTYSIDYPWYQVEFDKVYGVTKVLVLVRTIESKPTQFGNMEIRIGNVSGIINGDSGNFSENTFFSYYEGPANPREHIEFLSKFPVYGKFLSIQNMKKFTWVIFEEMVIFSE